MTTITLPMPPSLNNSYINNPKTRGRYKSARLTQWQKDAWFSLIAQKPPKIKGPVMLEYLFEDGGTKADLANLEKAPTDLLVTHGIIEGDGPRIVREIKMRWALGVKGCQVTIVNLRPQAAAELEYVGEVA